MSSPDAHASAAPSAGLLSDSTLGALELRRQPFTELPADGDLYADDTTAEQLADIRQALITGDDLLLILGPLGAGKSTLLAQLAADSGQRIQCFSVRGSPRFSTHNLFAGMLEAFRQPPAEELRDVLDALVPQLQRMAGDNVLCTVVLDDADRVAEAELTRLLSGMLYLNSRDETLLRIALSAQEAFEERIPELLPEGADLPYSGLVVEPFGAERAAGYLDFRLNQAGRFDAFPFSDREVEALNERAGGRPSALHVEAARELESRHAGDEALPAELRRAEPAGAGRLLDGRGAKLALGALALALILGGLLLSRPASEPVDEARYRVVEERPVVAAGGADAPGEGADGTVAQTDAAEERLRLVRELADARETAGAGETTADPESLADAAPEEPAGPTRGGPVTTEPLASARPTPAPQQPASQQPDATGAGAGGGADTGAGSVAAAPPAPAPAPEAPDGTELALAEPSATPDPAPEPAPAPAPSTDVAIAPSEPMPAPTVPQAPENPAAALPAPEAVPTEIAGLESPNWVLVQDPDRFTVQMSASTERASVEDFLVRTGLEAPNSIFAFQRDGVTWYALVHGLYGSIEEARLAIERMPGAAQTNQPWIRAVGRIQAALKAGN